MSGSADSDSVRELGFGPVAALRGVASGNDEVSPVIDVETTESDPWVTDQNQVAFDAAPVGMAILRQDGRFLRVNAAMSEITGYSADRLASFAPFEFIHPDDLDVVRQRASSLGVHSDRVSSTHRIRRADGAVRWVEVRTSLIRRPDPNTAYVLVHLLDVTERKLAEDELFRAREHAETITAAMAEGYCLFIDGRIAGVNRSMCELTGFSEDELIGSSIPLPFWPPDEIERIMAQRSAVLAAGGDTFAVPLMNKRGDRLDAEVTLREARNSDGSVLGYVTTVRDISVRTRYEAARARHVAEERALREITKLVATGAEQATIFTRVVTTLRDLFDADAASVVRFRRRGSVREVISTATADGSFRPGTITPLENATESGGQRPSDSRADGFAVPITVAGRPWGCLSVRCGGASVSEDAVACVEQFASIVALGIANAQAWDALAKQAATDSLTGLANRRTFQDRLSSAVSELEQSSRPLGLILIDIDHFKSINDTHGHGAGDQVLIEMTRRMTAVVRAEDLVARIGGEEFACLLVDADSEQTRAVAEEIRASVAGTPFAVAGTVTVSAGACTSEHCRDGDDLVRFADRALYSAKENGRNATVVYPLDVRAGVGISSVGSHRRAPSRDAA